MDLSEVVFDGQHLDATVRVSALREILLDTRFEELNLVWPSKAVTCSGEHFSIRISQFSTPKAQRGQELLMKAGDLFQRRISMDLRPPRLAVENCHEFSVTLVGLRREKLATTVVRVHQFGVEDAGPRKEPERDAGRDAGSSGSLH